ncbi:hypothetical protein EF148_06205 [Stenotrophomonas maltophilia]|uniref:Lipocalin-like domain-containing protein n=3 Tax=Stenotrophomonas TaxID=40323 RepID=A0AAD0FPW9_STEMA|nr:hypothetical protein SmaCSM2_16920 [Stenotrophomonas maltophilia]MBA2129034.1 hypothetical protein [Stenotrophomonas maltophilia]
MRRWTLTSLTCLSLVLGSFGAMAQYDQRPTWSLKTSLQGRELVGEWELSKAPITGDGANVKAAALAATRVKAGSTMQFRVKLIDPSGVATDITGSNKLTYMPKGCLTFTQDGKATVSKTSTPPWSCNKGDPVMLTIIYADNGTKQTAVNMYLLTIE